MFIWNSQLMKGWNTLLQIMVNWLSDFNGISTRQGLFYDYSLGNHVNCTFIFTFLLLFLKIYFCTSSNQIQIILKCIIVTLTSTTTPGKSEPGSNGNEEVLHSSLISRTGASPSDAISWHNKDTPFFIGRRS